MTSIKSSSIIHEGCNTTMARWCTRYIKNPAITGKLFGLLAISACFSSHLRHASNLICLNHCPPRISRREAPAGYTISEVPHTRTFVSACVLPRSPYLVETAAMNTSMWSLWDIIKHHKIACKVFPGSSFLMGIYNFHMEIWEVVNQCKTAKWKMFSNCYSYKARARKHITVFI